MDEGNSFQGWDTALNRVGLDLNNLTSGQYRHSSRRVPNPVFIKKPSGFNLDGQPLTTLDVFKGNFKRRGGLLAPIP